MTAQAKAPEIEETTEVSTRSPHAVFFEMEGVASSLRQGAFDIIKSILQEEKVAFTPGLFSRYCIHPSPVHYARNLIEGLGLKKQDPAKLAQDITNGIVMHLTSGKTQLKADLAAFLDAAKARDLDIAAMSVLPENVASQVFNKLGLAKWNVQLFAAEAVAKEREYPRSDAWLKIARSLGKSPRKCLAVASSHAGVRAALSSGMGCIAIPDIFTSFQDFSGVDHVLESIGDVPPKQLLASVLDNRLA